MTIKRGTCKGKLYLFVGSSYTTVLPTKCFDEERGAVASII